MQAIADELGMDMQVEDMQFDAIIAAVSSGKVDVDVYKRQYKRILKKN